MGETFSAEAGERLKSPQIATLLPQLGLRPKSQNGLNLGIERAKRMRGVRRAALSLDDSFWPKLSEGGQHQHNLRFLWLVRSLNEDAESRHETMLKNTMKHETLLLTSIHQSVLSKILPYTI